MPFGRRPSRCVWGYGEPPSASNVDLRLRFLAKGEDWRVLRASPSLDAPVPKTCLMIAGSDRSRSCSASAPTLAPEGPVQLSELVSKSFLEGWSNVALDHRLKWPEGFFVM